MMSAFGVVSGHSTTDVLCALLFAVLGILVDIKPQLDKWVNVGHKLCEKKPSDTQRVNAGDTEGLT